MILYEDELAGDARWSKLAEQFPEPKPRLSQNQYYARLDALQAAYWRLGLYVGHQKDDGYLGWREALEICRGKQWVLDALCTAVRGKPPLLHRPGDTCTQKNCIDASPPWTDGFDYRLCGFLKRNPSRKEKERSDTQSRELRDPVLRAFLFDRDLCCRYCRSGPLKRKGTGAAKDRRRKPVIEHVDPDRDGGPDRSNVVLACAACNEYKGRRTPDEADMVLLPQPTEAQRAWWTERGEDRFDRPEPGQQHPADTVPGGATNNAPDKPPDNAPTTHPSVVGGVVAAVVDGVVQGVVSAPTTTVVSPGQQQRQAADNQSEGSGSGRVGQPLFPAVLGINGQPIRAPDAPDIWTGRSRPGHDPPGRPPPSPAPRPGG